MLTLVSTLLGLASGGLPKVLDFVQDRGDKKHELALMAVQRERELALAKEGYVAQARVEEIKTELAMQTQAQERELRELIVYRYGTDAYVEMMRERGKIRDTRTRALANQRRKMKKFIANVLTIIAFAVVISGIVAIAVGIIRNI